MNSSAASSPPQRIVGLAEPVAEHHLAARLQRGEAALRQGGEVGAGQVVEHLGQHDEVVAPVGEVARQRRLAERDVGQVGVGARASARAEGEASSASTASQRPASMRVNTPMEQPTSSAER